MNSAKIVACRVLTYKQTNKQANKDTNERDNILGEIENFAK